jgi:hypothetical protein
MIKRMNYKDVQQSTRIQSLAIQSKLLYALVTYNRNIARRQKSICEVHCRQDGNLLVSLLPHINESEMFTGNRVLEGRLVFEVVFVTREKGLFFYQITPSVQLSQVVKKNKYQK